MKVMKAVGMILRALLWIGIGVALLVTALVMLLYSPWAQDKMREAAVHVLNNQPGIEMRLDKFSLRLPMRLSVEGLMMAQDGDTLVAVSKADADISLLPLLIGEVGVNHLSVNDLHYQMGNADSLMMMVIKADTVDIKPATVGLIPLKIGIDDGQLSHASVSLVSKPDTVATPPSESQMDMTIDITRLRLNDFTYRMAMEPLIDSLGATIGVGELRDGTIDLKGQTITLKDFDASRLQAAYIAAPPTEAAPAEAAPADTAQTAPWTIKIDNIDINEAEALYTTRGYEPQPGLDFGYIQAYDMSLQIKDFYNQQADITLPLKLHATERCGLTLDATGTFAMAGGKMLFENFDIATAASALKANGFMGMEGDMASAPVGLTASGGLGMGDVRLMFPVAKPYLLGFNDDAIDLRLGISGSMADLGIDTAEIAINRVAKMRAHGRIANMMEPERMSGRIYIDGSVGNAASAFAPILAGTGMAVPPLTLDGNVLMDRGAIDAKLTAATMQGRLALDAKYNGNVESYNVSLRTNKFPVQAFMPKMGVGRVTANVSAKGHGFDLFSHKTVADVSIDAPQVEYNGYDYTGITLAAHLSGGNGKVDAAVKTGDVDANLQAEGNLSGSTYDWTVSLDGDHIDLKAINMTQDKADLALSLDAKASISSDFKDIEATATLRDLTFDTPTSTYSISDVNAQFATSDTLTSFLLTNRDLHARAELPHSLDSIMARVDRLTVLLDKQMAEHQLHVDTLQKTMPKFAFDLEAGSNNLINDILKETMMHVGRVSLTADNDSTLSLHGLATQFTTGDMRIDTAAMAITQRADRLNLLLTVDNRPGNLDDFAHLRLNGIFNTNQLALRASQKNSQGATGYDLGAIVALADSTVNARLFPLSPTIGYKPWQVNFDNFISYNIPTKRIDANLRMTGEKSSLALYTEPSADSAYNDVVLKIEDLRLQDWLAINPFAPEISGDLSADVRLGWSGGSDIQGNGTISLTDLYYNRERVGTFGIDMDVSTNTAGMVRAKADLTVDGVKTATIAGNLNDSTALSPFNLDFSLIKFPLAVANPFLPAGTGRLTGTLNGEMLISGDSEQPIINGEIYFEDAALKLDMTNTSYAFSEVRIPVKDNLVQFNDFAVMGANENPLRLNGQVDLKSMSSPTFDLSLNAKNMMVVNTRSASHGATLYGKGYIDLDATAKGNMRFMSVKANLAVLSGTNVTYNLAFTDDALQSPAETDMVKFVNFTDTAMVAQADSLTQETMTMMLTAQLTIQSGVTVVVDLPSSARDKVQVQPQGTVNYTQMPLSDGRLTGRIDINSGFARYTLPVVGSEKEFTIDPDSYIAFNGDMLNPIL
ncbi:MAG: translocation/assembly module TamB, partial [Muribaculaceae bacterium]|nr:translocation/assembly module TamB [Muribaculaceae bacterium]